jgi:serine/threonine protein kinase
MAGPSSIEAFLELGYKSGLLEKKAVEEYCQRAPQEAPKPETPGQMANAMVRDGLLTNFQADSLLAGKWRGFLINGKYKLLQKVGAGGMGSVYLCEHIHMRRRIALKVLPLSMARDPEAVERFYREARAVAALDHPNIVRAHDIDREDDLHFLVMEYIDGNNLFDIIRRHGPMAVARAAHYIRQAALGLQHAHEAGLVHRDIKPGNLLLDRNGVVKVLDLGLARFFNEDEENLSRDQEVGNVLGTADYLAPEQVADSRVDIRADIYSLGVTLYYLLSGKSPFHEGTVSQKLIWHQVRQPKPIRLHRPDIPQDLAVVLEKMMAKDPFERYQSPMEVAEALLPWTQTAIGPPPEHEMPPLFAGGLSGLSGSGSGNTPVSRTSLAGLGSGMGPATPVSRVPKPAGPRLLIPVPPPQTVLTPPPSPADSALKKEEANNSSVLEKPPAEKIKIKESLQTENKLPEEPVEKVEPKAPAPKQQTPRPLAKNPAGKQPPTPIPPKAPAKATQPASTPPKTAAPGKKTPSAPAPETTAPGKKTPSVAPETTAPGKRTSVPSVPPSSPKVQAKPPSSVEAKKTSPTPTPPADAAGAGSGNAWLIGGALVALAGFATLLWALLS